MGENGGPATVEIESCVVSPNLVRFEARGQEFVAAFVAPVADRPGLVLHENEWRLSRFTYHTHREGKPLKITRGVQRPREKLLGFFATVEDCRQEIARLLSDDAQSAGRRKRRAEVSNERH